MPTISSIFLRRSGPRESARQPHSAAGSGRESPERPRKPIPRTKTKEGSRLLAVVLGCGGALTGHALYGQPTESQAGESAAEALKRSLAAQPYDMRWGPVRLRADASLGVNYTDNVFYSHNAQADLMLNPGVSLGAMWPITELNSLTLSLGLSYEWYLRHHALNADAPLVNPGSELAWNLFIGDFHIQLHDRFSYEQDLFFSSLLGDNATFYTFHDVGIFSRLHNQVGFDTTWDLNKLVLKFSYDHETFDSATAGFEYLNRESELLAASASFALGDHVKTGVENQTGVHQYDRETTLNNNWRTRLGPFAEVALPQSISVRAGGGLEIARYDATALPNNDYTSYYAYARIRQETRFFTHTLSAGRELLLGDLANNLLNNYVRYTISAPIVAHVDLGASASFNQGREFGGFYDEKFTYYGLGFRVGYQIHKHWRTDLSYEYRRKESNVALLDYFRNRVTLSATYSF